MDSGGAYSAHSGKTHLDATLAHQIAWLYVTHRCVTVGGIMTKMGL